jgi:hypothetical protein
MNKCDSCGTLILFGPVKQGDLRFCNQTCQSRFPSSLVNELSPELVANEVAAIHQGNCPKCGGPGPVDVSTSHRVWSIVVLTRWSSQPAVSCAQCSRRAKLGNTLFCLLFGWWGFPFGLLLTPIQIIRNLSGLFQSFDAEKPSTELIKLVSLHLGHQVAQSNHLARQAELAQAGSGSLLSESKEAA